MAAEPDRDLARLVQAVRRGPVMTAYDGARLLATTFSPTGVTAVVVGTDGRVAAVQRNLAQPLRLEPVLTRAYLGQATRA